MTLCEVQLIYSTVCFSSFDTRLFFFFVCGCVRVGVIIGLWVFCPSPSGKTLFFFFFCCCFHAAWAFADYQVSASLSSRFPTWVQSSTKICTLFSSFFFLCVYRLVSISNAIGFCFFSYCYLLLCCHVYLQNKPRQTCMRVELWIKKKKKRSGAV